MKSMEKQDRWIFLTGVTISIQLLFEKYLSLFTPLTVVLKFYEMDIDKNETSPKEKFHRVMILCLDLHKGDRDKGSNKIYSTIKKRFFCCFGTTQSKFDLLKKQILVEKLHILKSIDPDKLLNQH